MNSKAFYLVYSVLLTVLLSSCQATEAYRRAQTAFSQGATTEIQDRFADTEVELPSNFIYFDDLYQANIPVDAKHSATVYYVEALKAARTALKAKRQLSKNLALGNTYAIQALSLWRLGKYKQAKEVAALAIPLLEKTDNDESDVRDLAMMQALPGLINIDESYAALQKIRDLGKNLDDTEDEEEGMELYKQIKELFINYYTSDINGAPSVMRGLSIIEQAIDDMGQESAISRYLRNAQLAGIDNWGDAFLIVFLSSRRIDDSSEELQWIVEERETYKELIKTYFAKLEASLPNGKANKLYRYWVQMLGASS